MTVRHMVLFRFRPDIDPRSADAVLAIMAELPTHYPAMTHFGIGANVSERDDSFSHVMTMEFANRELLRAYLNSERHEALVRDLFTPNIAARAIASYELS